MPQYLKRDSLTGVLAQHIGHETDDDGRDVETCLLQQRYVMAVGLYITENYKMPQKTNYKIKAKLLLTVGHNMVTYTATQHVFFYRHYM